MHIAINKVFLVPLANAFRDDLKNVKFNDHEAKHSNNILKFQLLYVNKTRVCSADISHLNTR